MTDIILATTNISKIVQIKEVFAGTNYNILSLAEAEVFDEAVEDGETLKENALKKARFALKNTSKKNLWVMADDTGIFIEALDEKPGIHSARWVGENATTKEIMEYTLRQLVGKQNRKAYFKTAVALVSPSEHNFIFEETAEGFLLESPRGDFQPKMPYSSIFVSNENGKVWAEMTTEEENMISHRGKAFRKTLEFLNRLNIK